MSKAIQRRRGTTAEHAGFTGLVGELTIDTTKKTAVVHDGVTAGGHPLAKENHNHDTTYAAKAHESSVSAHPEMAASDAEVDAGTGSKWVKVSQLIRATVKTISSILPLTLGGTGASTAAGARTNLGLGSVATENTVPVAKGGTGATTATAARTNLGLGDAAAKTVAVTPAGAADAGKLPALDATGKLPVGFVPLPDLTYVPEAGHATTADSATTAGSANTATSATTAASATNADKVDGYHASQAANPNTIPVADAAGKLSVDWLPPMEAATVGGYSPSTTPGASKIPVADASGKLASGWIPTINADQVDGYHAQKTPAADRIPVAGTDGKLDAGWLPNNGVSGGFQKFTSSGAFIVPAGVTSVWVRLQGGGGGGNAYYSSTQANGSAGGTTSFGAYAAALGGGGGTHCDPGGSGARGNTTRHTQFTAPLTPTPYKPDSRDGMPSNFAPGGAGAYANSTVTASPGSLGSGGGGAYKGSSYAGSTSGAGGAGGFIEVEVTNLTPGASIPVTVGLGGAGGVRSGNATAGRGGDGFAEIYW